MHKLTSMVYFNSVRVTELTKHINKKKKSVGLQRIGGPTQVVRLVHWSSLGNSGLYKTKGQMFANRLLLEELCHKSAWFVGLGFHQNLHSCFISSSSILKRSLIGVQSVWTRSTIIMICSVTCQMCTLRRKYTVSTVQWWWKRKCGNMLECIPLAWSGCGHKYPKKRTLERHAQLHLSRKEFICSVCQKVFATSNSQNIHIHIKGKHSHGYVCPCGKCFESLVQCSHHTRNCFP